MMEEISNFESLNIKKFPKKAIADTPENKFWKRYEKLFEKDCKSSVSSISAENEGDLIAFSHSNTFEIYNTFDEKVKLMNSSSKSDIHKILIRKDGGLLATGQASGVVQVYDIGRKLFLRTWRNHTKAVHALTFSEDKTYLLTGSDDMSIRFFDIAINTVYRTYSNFHGDYIRSLITLPNTQNKYLSGSYDTRIHLFDSLSQKSKEEIAFYTETPVDAMAALPNGFGFVSVGSTQTMLWDIRNNSRPLFKLNNNQKNLTCVSVVQNGERIITSSIDQHIKIYKTEDMKVTHQFKYPAPIMSFGLTQAGYHLAVGTSEGGLSIKRLKKKISKDAKTDEELPPFLRNEYLSKKRALNYKYFYRGIYQKAGEDVDVKYEEKKKLKLGVFDKFLKKFQYKNAVLAALKTRQTDVIISLFEEIIQRDALRIAFKNWDNEELKTIFSFLIKKLKSSRHLQCLIEVMEVLFEFYGLNPQDQEVCDFFLEISQVLSEEIETEKDMIELSGALDTIINCSLYV